MTNLALDPRIVAATDFYDKHYALADPIFLEPGKKLLLGSAERPRHCRFCGKDEPEVTFKDEAHALPAAFGNTGLFSNYECDACNHLFGEGIENHLGNWSKPMRTLSCIKGRNGVPTIKKPRTDKGWRVEYSGTSFQLTEYKDEPFFEVDEQAKQLRFELNRDTYIPVAALKGLVKIGLTLIPDVETQHFRETHDWIRDTNHLRNFVAEFPVFRIFIPGPMRCRSSCRRSHKTSASTANHSPCRRFQPRGRPIPSVMSTPAPRSKTSQAASLLASRLSVLRLEPARACG